MMIILRLLAGGCAASSNWWSDNRAVGPVASMQSTYNALVPRLKTTLRISPAKGLKLDTKDKRKDEFMEQDYWGHSGNCFAF